MDQLADAAPGSTVGARVKAAAREAGISPADPLGPLIEAIADVPDEIKRRLDDGRLAQMLERAESVAGGQLARLAAAEMPRAVERLVLQRYRTLVLGSVIAAVAVLGATAAGAYAWGYRYAEAKYLPVPAALGVALTGPQAAEWLNLVRINDITAARQNCQPVPQPAGGEACAFTLWTKLPPTSAAR